MFLNSIGSTTLSSIKNANRSLLKCNNFLKTSKYLFNASCMRLNSFDLYKGESVCADDLVSILPYLFV